MKILKTKSPKDPKKHTLKMESEDQQFNLFTVGEEGEGEVENDDGDMVKYQYKYPKAWTYATMFKFEDDEVKKYFQDQNFDAVKPNEDMQKFEPTGKYISLTLI